MEVGENPQNLPMPYPISYLVPPNKMDLSKSKKLKLPENSKAYYLAMERRKKNLFKKGSELSTLCGIEVCVIVYDNQKPKTAAETWPNNSNDVLRMVQRCKGKMSKESRKEDTEDGGNITSCYCPANFNKFGKQIVGHNGDGKPRSFWWQFTNAKLCV